MGSGDGARRRRGRFRPRGLIAFRRRLPFPLDLAATVAWDRLSSLVRRSPSGTPRLAGARLRRDLIVASDLLTLGNAEAARRAADRILAVNPGNARALRIRLDAELADGRRRDALRTLLALRRAVDGDHLAELEQRVAGEILVRDTDWVPLLPGSGPHADPSGPSVVLVPPSIEQPSPTDSGSPSEVGADWVQAALTAMATAGLRPVVIVFGGARGVQRDGANDGDRIAWHSIDPGPAYPADPPADRAVLDRAWAAAAASTSIRPARVVALVDPGDPTVLIVGLSLRQALGCPLTAIVGPGAATHDHDPIAERLRAADRVISLVDPSASGLAEQLRSPSESGAPARVSV